MAWIEKTIEFMTDILMSGGPVFGVLLVLLESIIPALPLGLFVALNIQAYGAIFGFLLSWGATCLGCFLSYCLFCKFSNILDHRFLKKYHPSIKKLKRRISTFSFSNLVLVIALPFTPAFLINIACGLSKMPFRKFIIAIFLGKISIIFFWGFVGTSLIESITNIRTIILISILLILSYLLSKFVSHHLKID